MRSYIDADIADILEIKSKVSFLIVTVTEIERDALHARINASTELPIVRIYKDKQTFYLGYFGNYLIAHVESGMGSLGFQSSIITVSNAIIFWQPKAVIMPGIAFGVDKEKQKIGDVLVSEKIAPYNVKRVGKEKEIFRSPIPPCGGTLLNRFKSLNNDWKFSEESFSVTFTTLLSGESLVDNIEYRAKLLEAFPESKGGEMEGAGLFAAANDKNVEWIVIKSICDFADGEKNLNKKEYQTKAAATSVSFCEHVLSVAHAFDALKCVEFKGNQQILVLGTPEKASTKDVLFDIYNKKNERFYISRDLDVKFKQLIEFYSLWLHGPSGLGKTSVIRRYLELCNKKVAYISLGNCFNYSTQELLNFVLFSLDEINNKNLPEIPKHPTPIIPREIYKSFKSWVGASGDGYLYLDEIPVEDEKEYKVFINSIVGLLQYFKSVDDKIGIKIVVSSIRNVSTIDLHTSIKCLSENVKFIEVPIWSDDEIGALFDSLVSELKLEFSPTDKDEVVSDAKGSPRFVKALLKNYIAIASGDLKEMLAMTRSEIV